MCFCGDFTIRSIYDINTTWGLIKHIIFMILRVNSREYQKRIPTINTFCLCIGLFYYFTINFLFVT